MLAVFMIVVNAGDPLILRRLMGLFLSAPVWGLLLLYARRYFRASPFRNWLAWFPAAAFLFAAIPGFMLGPFYGGIGGWVISVDKTAPIRISGYKLVNDEGQEHWLNHAFLQPHGQIGRFHKAFRGMPNSSEMDFIGFFYATYERSYPGIADGYFPHQWALGRLAYPTHSLQKYDTEILAQDFAPEKITAIKSLVETYDFDGNFIETTVMGEYSIEQIRAINGRDADPFVGE